VVDQTFLNMGMRDIVLRIELCRGLAKRVAARVDHELK